MIEQYSPDTRNILHAMAKLIWDAECAHRSACLNLGTAAQVTADQRLRNHRQMFAVATGTAINGLHFKQLLAEAMAYEPKTITPAKVAIDITGGLIQSIVSEIPLDIRAIDYDDVDPDEAVLIDGNRAYVTEHIDLEVDKARAENLFEQIGTGVGQKMADKAVEDAGNLWLDMTKPSEPKE